MFVDENSSILLNQFQIRIESSEEDLRQFLIKANDVVVVKLNRGNVLYFDALTLEKAVARIKYTIDEKELPPPPPPVNSLGH